MRRIGKAAAGAAAAMALLGGIGGAALAAAPAASAASGAVRVCNPTAVEYGNTAPCERSNMTAIEYATMVEY
jgi:hypothetical protein